jgi:hypothetical protein
LRLILEIKDLKEELVIQDHKVHKDQQVHKVESVIQDQQVHKDQQDHKVMRE